MRPERIDMLGLGLDISSIEETVHAQSTPPAGVPCELSP